MTEGQITFRLDPAPKVRICELVDAGGFRTVSDFVNQTVLQKFEFEPRRTGSNRLSLALETSRRLCRCPAGKV